VPVPVAFSTSFFAIFSKNTTKVVFCRHPRRAILGEKCREKAAEERSGYVQIVGYWNHGFHFGIRSLLHFDFAGEQHGVATAGEFPC
jgi:hypothetical protein